MLRRSLKQKLNKTLAYKALKEPYKALKGPYKSL